MPAAQPDPGAKPTRKASKPKTAPTAKGAAELDLADLVNELRFLKGLVVGLQEEVLSLKETPKPESGSPASEPGMLSEPALNLADFEANTDSVSYDQDALAVEFLEETLPLPQPEELEETPAPIFQVEQDSVIEPPPIDYNDSAGPFQPFDPHSFAEDFSIAFEDPIPIDWAKWAEEEPSSEPLAGQRDEEAAESLEALAVNHPDLIETVLAFNAQHPPDFVVESPFDKMAESLSVKFEDHGVKVKIPETPLPLTTAHDIMAELVAEAVQNQAVAAEEAVAEVEPVIALDGLFPQSKIGGPEASFSTDIDTTPPVIDPEVLAQIPALSTIRACLLPLSIEEGTVTCGIPKPIDYDAIKTFEEETGLKVAMKPMGLREVVHGLREGYATKDEENFRTSLLSGAAPPEPITLQERMLASIPFLKAKK